MEVSTKERILLIINKLGISVRQFEINSGISNGYINNLKSEPSSKIMQRIFSAYPQVNPVYLMTGEGEMFSTSNNIAIATDNSNAVAGNNSQNESAKTPEEIRVLIEQHKQHVASLDKVISSLEAQLAAKDAMIKQLLDIISQKQ